MSGRCRPLVRGALALYPRRFRERFGDEMLGVLWRDVARARGRGRRAVALAASLYDLAVCGVLAHLDRLSRRRLRPPEELPMTEDLLQDCRYAVRTLLKQPGFALVVVATIALGVGANTAMFSVLDGVLLKPLPYREPEGLVVVAENDRLRGTRLEGVSVPDYFDWLAAQQVFSGMAAWSTGNRTLVDEGVEPERLSMASTSHTLFELLGVGPSVGRAYSAEEDRPGGERVAVLSDELWQRRFGGDRGILGRTVRLDGVGHTVIGVMPPGFQFPAAGTDLWLPLQEGPATKPRGMHNLLAVARLEDGTPLEAARTEMEAIMARLEEGYPDDNLGRGAVVDRLDRLLVRDVRSPLWVLMGAVGLVLFIACANVANLLYARAAARRGEVGVRFALGASRGRLVRQLLTESLLLAVLGGAVGVALAFGGLRLLVATAPAGVPRLASVGIDLRVLAFALGVSMVSGLLFGLAPALRTTQAPGPRGRGRRMRARTRRSVAVVELAVSALLVVCACLLAQTVWNLGRVDPGYRPERLVTASLSLPQERYPSDFASWPEAPKVTGFFDAFLERLAARPELEEVALALNHPANPGWTTRVRLAGDDETPPGELDEERIRPVTPGYFRTIGAPLLRGRDLAPTDRGGAPPVVVVNEAFTREYFPDREALGGRFTFWSTEYEIVGVVSGVRFMGVDLPSRAAMYPSLYQLPMNGTLSVVARHRGPVSPALRAIRDELSAIDAELALFNGSALEALMAGSLATRRFVFLLLVVFAVLALSLAAVGIYGVLSQGVNERIGELGVRSSLGAGRSDLLRLILGQALRLGIWGLTIGMAAAVAATRLLQSLLYGVAPTDLRTFVAVPLALLGVAMLASLVPARRASRIDPAVALRLD